MGLGQDIPGRRREARSLNESAGLAKRKMLALTSETQIPAGTRCRTEKRGDTPMRASPPGRPGASALARAADCCARLQTLLMVACLAVMVLLFRQRRAALPVQLRHQRVRRTVAAGLRLDDLPGLGAGAARTPAHRRDHAGRAFRPGRAARHARAVPAADAVGAVADGRGQLDPDPDRPGHAPAGHRPAAGGVQRRGAVCGGGHGPADAGGPGPRPGGRPLPAESSAENPLD